MCDCSGLLHKTLEKAGTRWNTEKGDIVDSEEALGDDRGGKESGEGSKVSSSLRLNLLIVVVVEG